MASNGQNHGEEILDILLLGDSNDNYLNNLYVPTGNLSWDNNQCLENDCEIIASNDCEMIAGNDCELIAGNNPLHMNISTQPNPIFDIDSAIDVKNYTAVQVPEKEEIEVSFEDDEDEEFENVKIWTNQPPSAARSCVEKNPRTEAIVKPCAQDCKTPIEAWTQFFTAEMVDLVVRCTNEHIKKSQKLPSQSSLKLTDSVEIKALIGLHYVRALFEHNKGNILTLSKPDFTSLFGSSMSINKFCFLNKHLCFDDIVTRNERIYHDRFTEIRELFEMFNCQCSAALNPIDFLTLNETFYNCRALGCLKQSYPNKPLKSAIQFKSMDCVRYPYTYRTAVHSRKPSKKPDHYYLESVTHLVKSLISDLEVVSDLKGKTITLDETHTNLPLFEWLLTKGVGAIGITSFNKMKIPHTIKKQSEKCNYEIFWEAENGEISLHSFDVQTKNGHQEVLLLTTLSPVIGTALSDGKCEPAVMKLYNLTKKKVTNIDRQLKSYTTNSKSVRWAATAFSYILDTARINAETLFSLNNGVIPRQTSSFEFGWQVASQLIKPYIEKRNIQHLSKTFQLQINTVLGRLLNSHPLSDKMPVMHSNATKLELLSSYTSSRMNCHICTKITRLGQWSLSRVKRSCQFCGLGVCKHHYIHACLKCTRCA